MDADSMSFATVSGDEEDSSYSESSPQKDLSAHSFDNQDDLDSIGSEDDGLEYLPSQQPNVNQEKERKLKFVMDYDQDHMQSLRGDDYGDDDKPLNLPDDFFDKKPTNVKAPNLQLHSESSESLEDIDDETDKPKKQVKRAQDQEGGLKLNFDSNPINNKVIDDRREDVDYDISAKPGFQFNKDGFGKKENSEKSKGPNFKINPTSSSSNRNGMGEKSPQRMKMKRPESGIDLSQHGEYSKNRFQDVHSSSRFKPDFSVVGAKSSTHRAKPISKSYSDGKLLKLKSNGPDPESILKQVTDFIHQCEHGDLDIITLFNLNGKGSYYMRSLNGLINKLVEKEKVSIMTSGPFFKKRYKQPKEVKLESLSRQQELAVDEIQSAQQELEGLDDETERVSHPLLLNELKARIEETEQLIHDNRRIVRAYTSGNKKDLTDLDKLFKGYEEENNRKKRELHNLEREADLTRIRLEANAEKLQKLQQQHAQQLEDMEEQDKLRRELESKISGIGLLDKRLLDSFVKNNREKIKAQKGVDIYKKNFGLKIQFQTKDTDAIKEQNILLEKQIEFQEDVIIQQREQLRVLLDKEIRQQKLERALALKRKKEMEDSERMLLMGQGLHDSISQNSDLGRFIEEYEKSNQEEVELTNKHVVQEDAPATINLWGNEKEEGKNMVVVQRPGKLADLGGSQRGNNEQEMNTISIQANTLGSEDFDKMYDKEKEKNQGMKTARRSQKESYQKLEEEDTDFEGLQSKQLQIKQSST